MSKNKMLKIGSAIATFGAGVWLLIDALNTPGFQPGQSMLSGLLMSLPVSILLFWEDSWPFKE